MPVYHADMKVALTADWIMAAGGAEQVIGAFADAFPDSPIFTAVATDDRRGPLKRADVRTSGLQRWFRLLRKHQPLLPWMPRAMESFDLRGYDVVLSSSHAVGKGVLPPAGALHVCYCHTPMRYAWFMEDDYLRDFKIPRPLWPLVKRQLKKLRAWDLATSKRVDVFLANSETTAKRIKDVYGRESAVVHPPVEDRYFDVPLGTSNEAPYFVAVGRLVPYKRFDLLIEAANAAKFRLKIAGSGQDMERLKKLAGPTVEFLGYVQDDDLPALYAGAEALLFPQEEDAGIVLLEAQACGTPVIAYKAGGALDLTKEHVSSELFPEQTSASLLAALAQFQARTWDRAAIRARVHECTRADFEARIKDVVAGAYAAFKDGTFARP
jgi:glycosyltransferase involved in cell wall biosynthesis